MSMGGGTEGLHWEKQLYSLFYHSLLGRHFIRCLLYTFPCILIYRWPLCFTFPIWAIKGEMSSAFVGVAGVSGLFWDSYFVKQLCPYLVGARAGKIACDAFKPPLNMASFWGSSILYTAPLAATDHYYCGFVPFISGGGAAIENLFCVLILHLISKAAPRKWVGKKGNTKVVSEGQLGS